MKVSEAKTKVCPFMSVGFVADAGDFRSGALVEQTCICGDCMAWEFTDSGVYTDEDYGHYTGDKIPNEKREGYCKRLEK